MRGPRIFLSVFIRRWVVDIVLKTARRVSREDLRGFHLFFMVLITIFVHTHVCRQKHIHTQCSSSSVLPVNLYLSLITVAWLAFLFFFFLHMIAQEGGFGCLQDGSHLNMLSR